MQRFAPSKDKETRHRLFDITQIIRNTHSPAPCLVFWIHCAQSAPFNGCFQAPKTWHIITFTAVIAPERPRLCSAVLNRGLTHITY